MLHRGYFRGKSVLQCGLGSAARVFSPAAFLSSAGKPMPVTVLSGFLGSGKTTLLQNALKQNKSQRFGLLVNDMASINIDAKLVKKKNSFDSDLIDTLELQNGCVCCSLADDMMVSVRQFIEMSEEKGIKYDHILLECSGIAEPRRVRDIFRDYSALPGSGLSSVSLDTFVTVVDAKVFVDLFGSNSTIGDNRRLAVGASFDWDAEDENETGEIVNSDYLDEASSMRTVTELLLEQVECADVIVINKIDLLQNRAEDIERIRQVVQSINPRAIVEVCQYGEVPSPSSVIGCAGGQGVAALDIVKEHKQSVMAGHNPGPTAESAPISHSHSHSHGHDHCGLAGSDDRNCSHGHDHSHEHHHDHASEETTALRRFGISSFVYRRRRPFHPVRFYRFIKSMGSLSIQGIPDISPAVNSPAGGGAENVKGGLLRSKGFVWLGSSASVGYYLSHSGQFLEMNMLGSWWAGLPPSEWPEDPSAVEDIRLDFEGEHGDRRQELIFIGQFESADARERMEQQLDSCLLTDDEMAMYNSALSAEDPDAELQHKFVLEDDSV